MCRPACAIVLVFVLILLCGVHRLPVVVYGVFVAIATVSAANSPLVVRSCFVCVVRCPRMFSVSDILMLLIYLFRQKMFYL